MEYELSEKYENQKRKAEDIINGLKLDCKKLYDELAELKKNKKMAKQELYIKVQEKQIEIDEVENNIQYQEDGIRGIFLKEIVEKIKSGKSGKNLNSREKGNEIAQINKLIFLLNNRSDINFGENQCDIIERKIKLEERKKIYKLISPEVADNNIKELQNELKEQKLANQELEQDGSEVKYKYDSNFVISKERRGEITYQEQMRQVDELEKNKEPATDEFIEQECQKLYDNYLEKKAPELEIYEREVSKRSKYSISALWKEKVDINKVHKEPIACYASGFSDKINNYMLKTGDVEYTGKQLGEEYAKGLDDERADLARQFAMLEVKGLVGDFENPYNRVDKTTKDDSMKSLLQFEKVNGLNIEEIEETIGLDTTVLHQDVFVATYEIEYYDLNLKENVMKPIKEYYTKDKNG